MSDTLRGAKSFGEKIARHIESELKLPRNWLDQDHAKGEPCPPSFHDEKGIAISRETTGGASQMDDGHKASEPLAYGGFNPSVTGFVSPLAVTTATLAPVIEWARVGVELYADNNELVRETQKPFASRKPTSLNVKCFMVPDNALFPDLRQGDWAFVDPENVKPERDKIAVFRTPDGAHIIRRFRPALNDDFEAYDGAGRVMTHERHGIVIVAALVTMQRDDV